MAQRMAARNVGLELRPPCIWGPLYLLAQREQERERKEKGEADLSLKSNNPTLKGGE